MEIPAHVVHYRGPFRPVSYELGPRTYELGEHTPTRARALATTYAYRDEGITPWRQLLRQTYAHTRVSRVVREPGATPLSPTTAG